MNPKARQTDLVTQEIGDELLVYDLKTNKAYCLNETSALIWQLCNGENSVTEIAEQMSTKMRAVITEDFVWIALDQLNKDELLEEGIKNQFEGLNRREIIRKVGFASIVALPVVSSIVAPTASNAASLLANLSTCSSNGDCASDNCFNSRCCTTGVNNSVPLTTCFCAAPGGGAPFAAMTCCATGTATQESTFPGGFCGSGAVLFSCDSEPRCF